MQKYKLLLYLVHKAYVSKPYWNSRQPIKQLKTNTSEPS